MFSKFLSLDKEKQDRVLNASMKEFANKGYDNASTNEIVKEANISKGLLFHYFQNKKQLFLFLYDYSIELITNELYQKINLEERDIIIRLHQIALQKLELLNKYPEIIKFIQTAYTESSVSVKDDLVDRNNGYIKNNLVRVFDNIDTSKFKEGVDIKKAINIIMWTFEGFGNSEAEKAKMSPSGRMDYDKVFAEGDIYIDMFKRSFYKDEYKGV